MKNKQQDQFSDIDCICGCGKKLTVIAVALKDPYATTHCCKVAHGVPSEPHNEALATRARNRKNGKGKPYTIFGAKTTNKRGKRMRSKREMGLDFFYGRSEI